MTTKKELEEIARPQTEIVGKFVKEHFERQAEMRKCAELYKEFHRRLSE